MNVRTHVNANGKPKRLYLTERKAEDERDQHCPAKDVYPCFVGAGPKHWHIGGSRRIAAIRESLKRDA